MRITFADIAESARIGYITGFQDARAVFEKKNKPEPVSCGKRYTTAGRFRDQPRPEPEPDSPLYETPGEVWQHQWFRTWLELRESVGTPITEEDYTRLGSQIYEMMRDNTVGTLRFRYGSGTYLYEVVEVEMLIRPTA